MNVQVFQHVPFEGLGSIEPWLVAHQARVTVTRFFEQPVLPAVASLDLLIVLGGPMSVNDEDLFPWLREEKQFVADTIRSGKAVLGICLGAQMIASALGAKVFPGPHKEIGWHEIWAEEREAGCFRLPAMATVFHWHGETFDLPAGAVRLAHSAGCRNQAFQIGRRVIGLQFHLETTPDNVAAMLDHCGDELVAGPYIQSVAEMASVPDTAYVNINRLMGEVLNFISGESGLLAGNT